VILFPLLEVEDGGLGTELTPGGAWMTNVGMPVCWQMAASSWQGVSMLRAMISSAWAACVPGVSGLPAWAMAARAGSFLVLPGDVDGRPSAGRRRPDMR